MATAGRSLGDVMLAASVSEFFTSEQDKMEGAVELIAAEYPRRRKNGG